MSDKEIEKIALKRYPVRNCYYGNKPIDDNARDRAMFIVGFKAAVDILKPTK